SSPQKAAGSCALKPPRGRRFRRPSPGFSRRPWRLPDGEDAGMTVPKWRRYLRFSGSDPRADADDELSFHLDSRIAEYRAMGMSQADAEAEAMRRFGDLAKARGERKAIDGVTGRTE